MSAISLRLPDSLHEAVRTLAQEDNVSINQFITLAVAEKVAALHTKAYLEERASRGSLEHLRELLSRAPDVEPDDADRFE